jgi:hypothetical protein
MQTILKGAKIIEEIKEIVNNWSQYAGKVNVSSDLADSITKTLVAFQFK